jgi:hypothetical protein
MVLLLAFVLQQTGAARCVFDPCDDPAADDGCGEPGEGDCAPSCADCSGCPGPSRGLVAHSAFAPVIPLVGTLPPSLLASLVGEDPHPRLDRPPRG